MKRFSEQLHKQAQTVKLKKSEQADLRERLVSYMEYHPLPASMKTAEFSNTKKASRTAVLTESFAQYAIPYQTFFKFGSVAAVFVLLVVPFMAERTVPGDTLYAVKVQFNEEVRGSLTWGSYEKVEWETERLNRRIAEARLLADEGLLTPEAEASVAAAVKEHSDNAKREIQVLRESDADEATIATIAFDSSLQVQAQALQNKSAIGGGEAAIDAMTSRGLISDVIDESLEQAANEQQSAVPAYGKLMARIELNTTRLLELRDSLEGVVGDQELVDVTRRIDDIDRAIAEAVELGSDEATELAAREALVGVLTRTQKLIVFMSELEVRQQIGIESVVPVVLTDDEISVERSKRQVELQAATIQLKVAINDVSDTDIRAKLTDAIVRLEVVNQELPAVESFEKFVAMSTDAIALAKDALILVGIDTIVVQQEVPVIEAETATTTQEVLTEEVSTSTDDGVAQESEVTEGVVEPTASTTGVSTQSEIDSI